MVARGKEIVPVRSLAINHNFKKETAARECFVCKTELSVYSEPVFIPRGLAPSKKVKPCLGAPWICPDCRLEPQKLAAARKAMERHFAECSGGSDLQIINKSAGGAAA